MHLKDRYKYYPQMEEYDALALQHMPYLMFRAENNYCSEVVNTDSNGFRFSGLDGKLQVDNLEHVDAVNIFTGGSSAFGVGATSDKCTISAYLSKATNSRWINLSGRAYSSTQEFITFAYYRDLLPSIGNVVIFSGFNDLYLYFVANYFNKQVGSFFNANDWINKMNSDYGFRSIIARPLINKMLAITYGAQNFTHMSDKDAVNILFHKMPKHQFEGKFYSKNLLSKHNEKPSEVLDIIRRNISNWKVMADSYNAKITYVLQPFSNWLPDRSLTENEKHVFDILDHSGGESFIQTLEKMSGLHSWYSKELSKVCEEQKINYYDSNSYLNKNFNEDIFVDRVHLTDYSNKILSEYILEKVWK